MLVESFHHSFIHHLSFNRSFQTLAPFFSKIAIYSKAYDFIQCSLIHNCLYELPERKLCSDVKWSYRVVALCPSTHYVGTNAWPICCEPRNRRAFSPPLQNITHDPIKELLLFNYLRTKYTTVSPEIMWSKTRTVMIIILL